MEILNIKVVILWHIVYFNNEQDISYPSCSYNGTSSFLSLSVGSTFTMHLGGLL